MSGPKPPSMPVYAEVEPGPALRGIVRRLWRFEGPGDASKIERIPPDGCAELIIHLAAPYTEVAANGERQEQPLVLFAGQLTRPLAITPGPRVATLGVRFEPDGARGFLGAPMQRGTDARLDLTRLHGDAATALHRALVGASEWRARFDLAEAFVAERLRAAALPADPIVRTAVERLQQDARGDIRGGLSERHFQRRFLDRVGVSARMLQSIFRFRRVFEAIESPAEPDWVAAALAAGYFDQPQMARDFRRFLGCTASEWARQKLGLATMLAAESYKPKRAAEQ